MAQSFGALEQTTPIVLTVATMVYHLDPPAERHKLQFVCQCKELIFSGPKISSKLSNVEV